MSSYADPGLASAREWRSARGLGWRSARRLGWRSRTGWRSATALGLADGLALTLGDGLGAIGDVQDNALIVLLSRVTAPVRARARPFTVAPEVTVIEVRAMIVPAKVEPVANVAELVTCQKTLQGLAPLISATGSKRR